MTTNAGKTIIVTGAGSGIGRSTVLRLAQDGANVIAVDLTEESLSQFNSYPNVSISAGDVTEQNTNNQMVKTALENYGVLDAVALNAGILVQGDIRRGSMADFDRVMDVNVRAVALGIKVSAEAMTKTGGSIVVTGSVSGLHGDSGLWAYNASKGAAVNLSRAAALDLGHLNIRVNAEEYKIIQDLRDNRAINLSGAFKIFLRQLKRKLDEK
jgi:NAD(P)-dependent dehydrogenase (short-subunit alcohol dehydrogenase family)